MTHVTFPNEPAGTVWRERRFSLGRFLSASPVVADRVPGRLGLPSAMTDSEAFNATKFSFCAYQSAGFLASLFRSCDLDALTPLARAASCLRFRGSTPRTFDSKSSLQPRAARTCGVVPDS